MNTLTNYFQKRLIEFGFPMDLNIEYSGVMDKMEAANIKQPPNGHSGG